MECEPCEFVCRDDALRASEFLEQAKALHRAHPVCDGHNDLPWCFRCMDPAKGEVKLEGWDLEKNHAGIEYEGPRHGCLHTDLARLAEGGVSWQYWSVYVPCGYEGASAVQATLEQIDWCHRLVAKYPSRLRLAASADDVERCFERGLLACMMGIEGGHQINKSLSSLRMFYQLGCRYMTLTHNGSPGWADPACAVVGGELSFMDAAPLGGLSRYGEQVVREMNRIGMLLDLSHVHHETMRAALRVSRAPVLFSHSSSRAVCDHPRDVPDDVLVMVKANGGLVMVTFVSDFVAGKFWVRGGKVGATVIEVADHIEHIAEVAGVDHVGLGGDYDGCLNLARGLKDVAG